MSYIQLNKKRGLGGNTGSFLFCMKLREAELRSEGTEDSSLKLQLLLCKYIHKKGA